MSQKPNIFTFDIRKLSLLKISKQKEHNNTNSLAANEWFHFPQRSDITINFFKYLTDKNSFHISIIWKGNILDQLYWHQGTNDFISSIGKYPSLGFKVVNQKGELLKRFQVSFNSRDVYDNCCKCVEEKLKVTLNQIDATAIGENSQIIDYPSHSMATTSQGPKCATTLLENTLNNQSYYRSSQALYKPQYIPPLKQQNSFSQLEGSTCLQNMSLEQQKQHTGQQVRGVSQSHNNYLLPQYEQQAYYTQCQPTYTYLQACPQQNTSNGHLSVQGQNMALKPPNINYNQEVLSHSNSNGVLLVSDQHLNNQMLINGYGSQNRTRNESLGCSQGNANIRPQIQTATNDTIGLSERNGNNNKPKPVIKEEEILPMEIGKVFNSTKSSTNGIQKTQRVQKPNPKNDLFKIKDSELKKLVTRRLKDQEFVKFVERLDKIVSQL